MGKPAITHYLFLNLTSMRIKKNLVFKICVGVSWPLMQPIFHRRVKYGKMITAHVIINRVLYDFHVPGMCVINQILISFFSSDSWVNFVMVRKSITMFCALRHVIFNYRVEPDCSNTKALQVIQMIFYSF